MVVFVSMMILIVLVFRPPQAPAAVPTVAPVQTPSAPAAGKSSQMIFIVR